MRIARSENKPVQILEVHRAPVLERDAHSSNHFDINILPHKLWIRLQTGDGQCHRRDACRLACYSFLAGSCLQHALPTVCRRFQRQRITIHILKCQRTEILVRLS